VSSAPHTATPPARAPAPAESASAPGGGRRRLLAVRPHPRHLALAAVLALSTVLNTYKLSQNGYANIFYSAGVKSMLRSLHNFVFVSFDPGGLVSVDKPPLALWVQAASAKLFGFSPLSLLLPEAIAGVLAVALLYYLLARRLGAAAGLAGALAMAVFPSFVAVSRENGVDPVLILLMLLACAAGLRAAETGRWRTLLCSAVLVGLAFNTKTLAALLVVPGIAVAYLLCAPGSIPRRVTQLVVGGLVMAVVSFAWIAFVDLTPAAKRPYVGSSTNNSELGLTFEYNGFGRVGGQVGGPGQILVRPGARVPAIHHAPANATRARKPPPTSAFSAGGPPPPRSTGGREKNPIPFGGSPGPLRLFGKGLGDQGGWMIPFALFGLLGLALLALLDRDSADSWTRAEPVAPLARAGGAAPAPVLGDTPGREPAAPPADGARRRDRRLATVIVLGGWFLVEAIVLSTSKGIVHPYYMSALAPGTGAMAGAGAVAFVKLARGPRRPWALALASCAVAATVAVQLVLMHREHYLISFEPVLVIGAGVAICALIALRRLAAPSVVLVFLLLLVVPTAYASSTWLAPVEGTFPAAGPRQAAGTGGYGINKRDLAINLALLRYVRAHRPGSRWAVLTVSSQTAAPLILNGLDAGTLGGYSGTDPVLDGPGLARLIAAGQARYVLLGGEFSTRGGNGATQAVLRDCRQLDPDVWKSPVAYPYGLVLFDCAGRTRALSG
jgi:4-amino-4-deoxy-L-arabinose transferase-like glycosyltransferase